MEMRNKNSKKKRKKLCGMLHESSYRLTYILLERKIFCLCHGNFDCTTTLISTLVVSHNTLDHFHILLLLSTENLDAPVQVHG